MAYLIGIDLGTTNCTVAYAPASCSDKGAAAPKIESLEINQLLAADREGSSSALPSFIYFPVEKESDKPYVVGTFARDRGGELPGRLISSAKSWLCHSAIDRRAKLLPYKSEETDERMSPVEACGALLTHLRDSWEQQYPEAPLADQSLLITVPASFDPDARQLVLEAAESAGFPQVVLLEEPQAAFYAWLHHHNDSWRKQLSINDRVLVIDIGGGTTDFTLISVKEEDGDLSLERVAVGSHLLLGGDNMDLALAYTAKQQLEDAGHSVDDWQLKALVHSCRSAKEKLLSDGAPDSIDVVIQGRGRKLVGKSVSTAITRKAVTELLIDGFIPLVKASDVSARQTPVGLSDVGLPYAQDPRISCQLAAFLAPYSLPTHVLFNGGTTKSPAVRERLMALLNQWAAAAGSAEVRELPGCDYDRAVSIGAVYYGLARDGQGVRIRGGTSRSYFIGIEEAIPAIPGRERPVRALCIAPLGMEEGTEVSLDGQEFSLVLGENAQFRFFSLSTPTLSDGDEPIVGTVVKRWKQELTELHPIETHLDAEGIAERTVTVGLKARVTELGVLELWCVGSNDRRWKLEFTIREQQLA